MVVLLVLPKVTGETHAEFPNASSKMTVKEAVGMGRYVVANEEIATGDVVVVEPPYAACLLPECFGSHCHHCFERYTVQLELIMTQLTGSQLTIKHNAVNRQKSLPLATCCQLNPNVSP